MNTGIKGTNIAAFEMETGGAKERKRVLEGELDELAKAETQASNDVSYFTLIIACF